MDRYGFIDWDTFDVKENGNYVLYTDHLAAITEKDRVIIKLLDKIDEVSDLKDREIAVLRALLPDNVEVIMKENSDEMQRYED